MSVLWTGVVVLLANLALLVLQLVGGRWLSPFIGSSLETWTSVIGVILAGISAGNVWGGRLADRSPTPRTLRRVLAVAGVVTLAELGLILALEGTTILSGIPLLARIGLLTFVTLFPPAFVLSVTTPLAIRLVLPDLAKTGGVVGKIYALGTLGSLVGNFLTGYVLMAHFTTHAIAAGVGVGLLALAALTPGTTEVIEVTPVPQAPANPDEEAVTDAAGDDRLPLAAACFTVFFSSFASMALELTASRMTAPFVGVSLLTWTTIIGVVLTGISVGNWLGGWTADRRPSREVLGFTQMVSGLAILFGLTLWARISGLEEVKELGVIGCTLLLTTIVHLPALLGLGMVSPQATRLAVRDVAHAGRVAGLVYAWSCAGAIAGTFATGWWLIAALGMFRLMFFLSAGLILLSIATSRGWRRPLEMAVTLAIGGGALYWFHSAGLAHSPFSVESRYFAISIRERPDVDGFTIRSLALDHLVHSMLKGKPGADGEWHSETSYLGYPHENAQADFCRLAAQEAKEPRLLVIGGGGYTLPRWVEKNLPQASMEVVEIDPAVTEVSHLFLGLDRGTKIVSHHLDGRQFVQERATPGSYDLVMQDAVNDLSVPAHLMTKEYNDAIRRLLKPEGIYLLTVIDDWSEGRLYRSALATLRKTFPHVTIVMNDAKAWLEYRQVVMVLYGSNRPIPLDAVRAAVKAQSGQDTPTVYMETAELDRVLAMTPHTVLTDAFAPVDNLMTQGLELKR